MSSSVLRASLKLGGPSLPPELVPAWATWENFRDLDFHYVTPIVIQKGQTLSFSATCTSSGACDPSVYFDGFVRP